MKHHTITFQPSGRGKAQCPPDPDYPDGVFLDLSNDAEKTCLVELPYPAPECGLWFVECQLCSLTVAVTAAGRVDDPVVVELACIAIQ